MVIDIGDGSFRFGNGSEFETALGTEFRDIFDLRAAVIACFHTDCLLSLFGTYV
jgi:hypothetical protein